MPSSRQSMTLIYEGRHSLIYYQLASKYDTPVVLKVLQTDPPTSQQLIHFNNEYEFTKDLAVEGVRKAIAQIRIEGKLALVLEYISGQTLHQAFVEQKQSLIDILQTVIQIAQILGEVHQHQIIHKNITSHNILVNLETTQVKLIDFGLASRIDLREQHLGNPEGLEGTLAYISPEQTGRMNRIVDYRTDLYSLGVTFYEMLTGQLPFRSDDPLALVHAHIAKTPRPVTALNPAIPPILAKIVMKLLAKNAEDRYQSAFGLQADLERCLTTLKGSQDVQKLADLSFALGQEDYSRQLHIPQKLYGRTAEIATLLAAFERVAAGNQELMLVAGYAGVGKSALVTEIHKPITEKRGYFISGKFDQYHQNTPYMAFTQAFNQLAEFLLTESETTLQAWRDTILATVGSNGAVLTEVMPSLEKVLGEQPTVPKLDGYENRNRFNLTFQNFVQAISTAEHPLVVFIDDWQWADLSSLELLNVLLTGEKIPYLLLIGAYRDNEVGQTHPFIMTLNDLATASITIQTIELGNLQLADVGQLIQESLTGSPIDNQALAELIYEKTQGNAFFTHQFLQNLYVEGWLQFDFNTRCWTWDIAQLNAQHITDNVIDLMARKLSRLAPETANLLQLAACIGNEFDLQTLTLIGQTDVSTALELLSEVLSEGFVIPLDNYYKLSEMAAQARFSFLHDRVQQAAYAQISAPERQYVHLEIGRLLLANTPETDLNQRVFEIVQHYNQASGLVTDETERLRIAELNMHAADLAYRAAAFGSAQTYLETAMSLMLPDAWSNRYHVMLNLHSLLATVLSLTGDTEQLERIYQTVEKQAHTMTDTAQVKKAKIQSLLYHGNYAEAIELGLTFVQAMGIPINRHPSSEEAFNYLQETAEWLSPVRIEMLRHLDDAPAEVGLILEVASTINGPLYNSEMTVLLVFVSQITRLCIERGLTPWAPVTLITFAIVLCSALHDIPKAHLLTAATMQLFEERYRSDNPISPLSLAIGGFIVHRYDHLKHTLSIFIEGVQKGLATGTFQFVGYCAWWQVWHYLFLGEPLSKAEAISQQAEETCQKIQLGRMKDWCLLIHQAILNLQGKSEVPWILKGDIYDEREKLALAFQLNDLADVFRIFFYKAWLHYVFGRPQAAVNFFRETESYALYGSGTYLIPLFYFYDTLANAAVYADHTTEEQPQILERINRNLKELEVWVRFAPMNHQHKQDLMEAEKARLEGRYWEAATFYERAIQGARENEFLHEEALAYERAADFYLSCGMEEIARLYMTRAYDGYSRWQAQAKVHDLEKCYPQWFAKSAQISPKESFVEHTERLRSLDLKSVIKASQAISEQIVLEELLRKLVEIVIENAGAQRGCLILEKDGKWVIEAEGTADVKDMTTLQAIEVEESDAVCSSIVRYVARSHESIVLDDAAQKGPFVDDPYVKQNQTKSVLCIPLLNRGTLNGILYLENNLAADTFTPERIEVLELLAGQAAIALENAVLYHQAQQEIMERKQAEEALRESEQRFRTIFDSVNDAIFVHDPVTGDILDVNAKMCTMYGYTREEALQIRIKDLSSGETPYTQKDALAWMKKAFEGEPQLFEWHAQDKGRRLFWVEINMRRAAIGGQDRVLVVVRDITERKQVDAALRESRAMLKQILDTVPQSIFWKDKDSVYLGCNQVFAAAVGISAPEDIIGKTDFDLPWPRHEAEAYRADDALVIASQTPKPHIIEPLQQVDGVRLWIDTTKLPLVDSHGDVYGVLGVYEDITERKRTEEALRENEARYRAIIESQVDLISRYLPDTTLTFVNDAYCHFYGKTREELIGHSYMFMIAPEYHEQVRKETETLAKNGSSVIGEYINYRYDGKECWIQWSVQCIADENGRVVELQAVGRDITERKQAEEALRESAEQYRIITNTSMDGFTIVDITGRLLDVNEAYSRMIGYSHDELLKMSVSDIEAVATPEEIQAQHQKTMVGSQLFESRHRCKDGRIIDVEVSMTFMRQSGQVLAFLRDITERKKAEEALKASETRYRRLYETMMDAFASADMSGRIQEANPAYQAMFGYSLEELCQLTYMDLTPENWRLVEARIMNEQVLTQGFSDIYEKEHIKKDGTVFPTEVRALLLRDDTGQPIGTAAILRDITERKRAEAEREKLIAELEVRNAELERFTYTVSHDLKSPLITIRGFLGYLTQDALSGNVGRLQADIARITDATDTMQDLLNDLLELSRIGRLMNPPEAESFEAIVQEALKRVEGRLTVREVQVEIVPGLPMISGDRPRLVEVVQNLVDNAIKFMGNQPKPQIKVGVKQQGDETLFFVADNGIGIAPQYHEKIFGLFERLDPTIEGTGVGLTLVKRIVEVHGGRIWVESDGPGQGSTFYFTLPHASGGTL